MIVSGYYKAKGARFCMNASELNEAFKSLLIKFEYKKKYSEQLQKAIEKKLKEKVQGKSFDDPENFDHQKLQAVQTKIANAEKSLSDKSASSVQEVEDLRAETPVSQWGEYKRDWRKQKEKLVISEPIHYSLVNGKIVREFTMDLNSTIDYQLGIVNKAWTPAPKSTNRTDDESANDTRRYFAASIKCDADFRIKKSLFTKIVIT